jgi:hypothetical protein
MITLGRISIPFSMAPPTWWTRQEAERAHQFTELERKAAEMARTVREHAPSSRSQGDPGSSASSRIYARRALPAHRDPVCRLDCHQLDNGGGAC